MRKLKFLFLILYILFLLYLIYLAYRAWQTILIPIYLAIIALWTSGVWALSRIIDWLFHENTEGNRIEEERLRQERTERRKQLQEWIQEHNQMLINTFIKPWSKSIFVDEPNTLAIEHLQIGYPDVWKLRPDKSLLRRISDDREIIKEEIISKFGGIPADFEWKHNPGERLLPVYRILEDFFQKDELPENYNINMGEFNELIIKDEPLYEKIKKTDKNEGLRDEKINAFEQGLKKIVHDFEIIHIPLEGTCKDCKYWHNKLDSLK